jgi:hypothetical protein
MSQVTKPIALDETLQDVVTAIQGITQGGMIVSTGNVGSATQPVYIDGGVPTAVNYNINIVSQADSTIETLVTQIKTKAVTLSSGAYSFFGSWNSHSNGYQASVVKGEESATFWKVSGTVYEYAQGRVWTFIDTYNPTTQAWSGVKIRQISGITTGTPTNPATGLTLQDSQFEKSGNVVVFRVAYKCTSNVTLTGGFAVCTLPWTPAYVTRVTRIVGDTNDSHTQNMSYGTLKTDKKLSGGPNDAQ